MLECKVIPVRSCRNDELSARLTNDPNIIHCIGKIFADNRPISKLYAPLNYHRRRVGLPSRIIGYIATHNGI